MFKSNNINTASKPNQKLLQAINTKQKPEDTKQNGVYSIKCNECEKYYIGQTKKQLTQRYEEHKKAYNKPHIYNSNLATHAIENSHAFPPIENVKLIKNINKGLRMNIWENMNIFKFKHNDLLIDEQIQINTKQDQTFKIIKIKTPIQNLSSRTVGNTVGKPASTQNTVNQQPLPPLPINEPARESERQRRSKRIEQRRATAALQSPRSNR